MEIPTRPFACIIHLSLNTIKQVTRCHLNPVKGHRLKDMALDGQMNGRKVGQCQNSIPLTYNLTVTPEKNSGKRQIKTGNLDPVSPYSCSVTFTDRCIVRNVMEEHYTAFSSIANNVLLKEL